MSEQGNLLGGPDKDKKKAKHDKIFRKALENPLVAHELFNAHLPPNIKSLIDFPSLAMENTTFVESSLKDSISDVLFSCKFDKQDGYLFLLVEHQSKADHFMAFRLFKYMINICERYLIQNPQAKTLPLIYPMIFFNGQEKYNVARNLWDLFANNKLARELWINDYQLVNVHEIPDEEFKQRIWSGILEFFLKHIHERELLKRWQEISDILPELTKITIGYDYLEMILYYTLTKIEQADKIKLENLLSTKLNPEIGTRLMRSLAEHWQQEGKEIGILEGLQVGETKGIQIGEAKGIQIGKAEGKAEGEYNKAVEVAKKMLAQGCNVSLISSVTGLDKTFISSLE